MATALAIGRGRTCQAHTDQPPAICLALNTFSEAPPMVIGFGRTALTGEQLKTEYVSKTLNVSRAAMLANEDRNVEDHLKLLIMA